MRQYFTFRCLKREMRERSLAWIDWWREEITRRQRPPQRVLELQEGTLKINYL